MTVRHTMRGFRRIISIGLVVACAVLALAACGKDPASIDGLTSGGGGTTSPEMLRQQYDEAMARVRSTMEDPKAPPFAESVAAGNKQQLLAAAVRWDDATAILAGTTAPKDIAADHKRLLAAMTELGDWNRKMAKAAPNVQQVKQLFRQAQSSAASRTFGEATAAIEAKGYHVQSDPNTTPLDSASSPAG